MSRNHEPGFYDFAGYGGEMEIVKVLQKGDQLVILEVEFSALPELDYEDYKDRILGRVSVIELKRRIEQHNTRCFVPVE